MRGRSATATSASSCSPTGRRIQAIAFRAVETALGEFLFQQRGETVHVAGALAGNSWNGGRSVQLRIVDAAAALG